MEVILEGYAMIEGEVRAFAIRESKWYTELCIDLPGAPMFPYLASVISFQTGSGMISLLVRDEKGRKTTVVLDKYRPRLAK